MCSGILTTQLNVILDINDSDLYVFLDYFRTKNIVFYVNPEFAPFCADNLKACTVLY